MQTKGRTAGLSRDGKTLYLLAVDGRRRESVGATEDELGLLMRRLGAQDALGFDGGGSTALALRYPDGSVRAANAPVRGFRPGGERGGDLSGNRRRAIGARR